MMNNSYDLERLSKKRLIFLIEKLLIHLSKTERVEFVSRWINPSAALKEANLEDENSFVEEVRLFCEDCLSGELNEEWEENYNHDEDVWAEDLNYKWSKELTSYIKQALMFYRANHFETVYTALDLMIFTLTEAASDEHLLGTREPIRYIDVDWHEVFHAYFFAMKKYLNHEEQFFVRAIEIWTNFYDYCTDAMIGQFDEIKLVEVAIISRISGNCANWSIQHRLFSLLKLLYLNKAIEYDEISLANGLLCYNVHFINDVAKAYMKKGEWEKTIKILNDPVHLLTDQDVIDEINQLLLTCYENLEQFSVAYELALKMFFAKTDHSYYLRARTLSIKLNTTQEFIEKVITTIQTSKRYNDLATLIRIFSYEGDTQKLVATSLNSDHFFRHDCMKFALKSLIFRALSTKKNDKNLSPEIIGIIHDIETHQIEGIYDMITSTQSSAEQQFLLKQAIMLLEGIVQFHIQAGQRSRYARAAYYISVIKGISHYINAIENFNRYYATILLENKKKSALKDEIKKIK